MEIKPNQRIHSSIFLAGSIEQDTAERWQERAVKLLGDNYIIYNPRRDDWDPNWKEGSQQMMDQIKWEMDHLESCDHIIMYFDPDTKSPITLLELGLYAGSGKLYVCCPEGFWRRDNVRAVCEEHGIKMFDTLEDMIQAILSTYEF